MAISTRQVKNKRDSNGVLTGRPGTVYDVNIKYTAPNGEKKTYSKKGFPTKKEATQHEAEMKAKLHNPGQIASIASQRKQTVASYLNEWVESYARVNLRPSTYDGYKKTIANYINPYIGGVALNQLIDHNLFNFIGMRAPAGNKYIAVNYGYNANAGGGAPVKHPAVGFKHLKQHTQYYKT